MAANVLKTKWRDFFLSNTHESPWPSEIFFIYMLFHCCSWNGFWNPRERGDSCRQVEEEAMAVTVQCILNSSNWGPIYTSRQTDIMLAIADVARKGYCRLFYVGSEAMGVPCGGSQVGSCSSLTWQSSWLLWWRLNANCSVISVGWRDTPVQYFQHGLLFGLSDSSQIREGWLDARNTFIHCEEHWRCLLFTSMIGIFIFPSSSHIF